MRETQKISNRILEFLYKNRMDGEEHDVKEAFKSSPDVEKLKIALKELKNEGFIKQEKHETKENGFTIVRFSVRGYKITAKGIDYYLKTKKKRFLARVNWRLLIALAAFTITLLSFLRGCEQ